MEKGYRLLWQAFDVLLLKQFVRQAAERRSAQFTAGQPQEPVQESWLPAARQNARFRTLRDFQFWRGPSARLPGRRADSRYARPWGIDIRCSARAVPAGLNHISDVMPSHPPGRQAGSCRQGSPECSRCGCRVGRPSALLMRSTRPGGLGMEPSRLFPACWLPSASGFRRGPHARRGAAGAVAGLFRLPGPDRLLRRHHD
jgi:hypothetical protein